jgi:multidrug resistance efflux pump
MKRVFVGLVVIALVALGAYFYPEASTQWAIRAAETKATPLPVVTVSDQVLIDAIVVPVRQAALSLATGGLVAEVLVNEGDTVKAGQLIARLANSAQLVAITQAEARLRAAEARLQELQAGALPQEIAIAQADLDVAQANLMKVNESPPLLTSTALETNVAKMVAEAAVRRAQAELELQEMGNRPEALAVAEAAIAEAQADLKQRELALAATEVRAPFDGIVAVLDLEVGEQVMAGSPVVQVADLSRWQIRTNDLSEYHVVKVTEGTTVSITVDAVPDLLLTGKLVHIRPQGENKQGQITYTAIIQPDQSDPRLRWNMTAAVRIEP